MRYLIANQCIVFFSPLIIRLLSLFLLHSNELQFSELRHFFVTIWKMMWFCGSGYHIDREITLDGLKDY